MSAGSGAVTVAADATVNRLLAAYVRAIDAADTIPVFSLWRYGVLGLELIRWEFALIALFFTPFLDLLRLALQQAVGTRLPSPTGFVWFYVKRPFAGLWRGDISGLQVVRVRVLTRAFLGSHVAGVLDQLKQINERARLDLLMQSSIDDTASAAVELLGKKLDSLAAVAKAQNAFGAVLATGSASALPLGLAKLLIPAIMQMLPGDVADSIGHVMPLGQLLKTIGLAGDEGVELTPMLVTVGGGFLAFLLITAMSCHIDKRRILAQFGTYDLEDTLRRERGLHLPELPLDIAFAAGAAVAGFSTSCVYSSLSLVEPDRSDSINAALAELAFSLVMAVIAAARRIWLRRPPSMQHVNLMQMVLRFLLWHPFRRWP